jgi:hypothetical protein
VIDAGVCRHCAAHLGYIENKATLKISTFRACPHCDSPCLTRPCKRCSKMGKTVRIVDKDIPTDKPEG